MARSLLYRRSYLYTSIMKVFHGRNYSIRYKYMASQIGKNVSVMEAGAGPGIISSYLDKSCTYYGFDINPDFVRSARSRGLNVHEGNIRDKKLYLPTDVTILIDVIHHLNRENQDFLLKNVLRVTRKKVIICEPFMHSIPILSDIPFTTKLNKALFEYIERDGNNEARIEHIHSKEKLRRVMNEGFGVIPEKTKKVIKEIGDDLIVTYALS